MSVATKVRRYQQSSGPRTVPTPRVSLAATTFNGTYLRPNIANGGVVPAAPPICTCPDIWIAGPTAVGNFQTALATTASYQQSSSANLTQLYDNYIYVRAMNGMSATQTRTVQLYYAPSGVIQWPGQWVNNVIPTDQSAPNGYINNLAAGQIGVADSTFLWRQVPPPPSGSDHYCLFAQLNSVDGTLNPFPDVTSQVDMGALITSNLNWGWRNTTLIAGAPTTFSVEVPLTIAQNMPPAYYSVFVSPVGFIGWNVWFTCSQNDANGKAIQLLSALITQDGAIMGAPSCLLNPGFNALITIYMESNGKSSSAGAKVPLAATYVTTSLEADDVVRRGLIDWDLQTRIRRSFGPEIGPTPVLLLGEYTHQLGGSNATGHSRRK
jgi:hypothetical protein